MHLNVLLRYFAKKTQRTDIEKLTLFFTNIDRFSQFFQDTLNNEFAIPTHLECFAGLAMPKKEFWKSVNNIWWSYAKNLVAYFLLDHPVSIYSNQPV